jgi:adenylate kinase
VFVGGVFAVGKTTACKAAATQTGFMHATASSLIKAERFDAIPNQGKAVLDIAENQRLLIRAVDRLREHQAHGIVIDGHFTIPNSSGNLDAIPSDVFLAMNVTAMVVYQDNPAAIATRVATRDDQHWGSDSIASHQDREISHARMVAKTLGIPLLILDAFDSDGLADALRQWSIR